ncbi:MAG TPA: aryl-sulfate sulfotransferase [Vicinamibacterales bacterium]|nr:aryl-sulfate sulfotransferase [Vicinamibacterales bacterium]
MPKRSLTRLVAIPLVAAAASLVARAAPSVYPTGTTIYDPTRAWSGYSVFVLPDTGAVLIDMNGNVLREWPAFEGASGGPTRVLPGGVVMGALGSGRPHQESLAIARFDWTDTLLWKFDHADQIQTAAGAPQWSARQHHDWQRSDFPAGYYSPEATPSGDAARTLILAHKNHLVAAVTDRPIEDDWLYEVDRDGKIVWQWLASDHIDEMGFSPAARRTISAATAFSPQRKSVDWLHTNSAVYVGPNRWFDAGDERFRPDNVLISSREASFMAIVSRSGKIVWRMGPDYRESDALKALGQIIGQHHPHVIPKGLPGAGNLLVFDNGGASGYGEGTPAAPSGVGIFSRGSSRVLEIDPVTLKKVWEYSIRGTESYRFFSHYVSAAQRLVNGNTMITEGADGRVFEVTPAGESVWEYVSPYFTKGANATNRVYRAYRVPYAWVPQLPRPEERAVVPPNRTTFRVAPR